MIIRNILAAIDFSPVSRRAAARAAALAAAHRATLTLLHVDELTPGAGYFVEPVVVPREVWSGVTAARGASSYRSLEELQQELASRFDCQVRIDHRNGAIAERVLDAADELGADLLVVGSVGADAFTAALLGTVSMTLARRAACPVIVERPGDESGEPASETMPGVFRDVLVPVDYSRLSSAAIHVAASLAAPGGRLHVLHVWRAPAMGHPISGASGEPERAFAAALEDARTAEAARLEQLVATTTGPTQRMLPRLESGSPAPTILRVAEELDADLVVMGSHAPDDVVERVIGTVADRVLRAATMPVAVVPVDALARLGASEPRQLDQDVDRDVDMSFPASDPPSWSPSTTGPPRHD